MKLPPLEGELDQNEFFVYAAADSVYFDTHAIPLINSIISNTAYGVHIHIYNPTEQQIDFCKRSQRVSVSWETFDRLLFESAVCSWARADLCDESLSRRNRMLGIKVVDRSKSLQDNLEIWLKKTYYACVRFIRLAELLKKPVPFLAIDVDGIVRNSFTYEFDDEKDFYLHAKEKGGHLAGAVLGTTSRRSIEFVQDLADSLSAEFEKDNIYWFLDQTCIDAIVHKYNKGYLPLSYIDWYMKSDSAIWSAKGKRKELEIFKREQMKYIS